MDIENVKGCMVNTKSDDQVYSKHSEFQGELRSLGLKTETKKKKRRKVKKDEKPQRGSK